MAQENTSAPRPSVGATVSVDGLTLPDPLTGLAELKSYHIVYTSSVNGKQQDQDTESSLAIEAWKNGADESALVQQTSSGSPAVYLNLALLGGEKYSQLKEGGACQAAASSGTLFDGLGIKLPPVFGAKEAGQETVNEIPAMHYTFDEKAVAWQAGKNGKAQGELWIAAEGSYVVKYTLSIQIASAEFSGTRSWSYELSDAGAGTAVALPQGCLALLSDIPVMDGANGVIQRPGFQKYTVQATLDQVSQFFADKLGAAGWSLLPGVEPDGGKVTLRYVEDQSVSGGRFVVIQVEEASGTATVIVQSAKTRNAIKMDPTSEPGAEPSAESPTQEPGIGEETPEVASSLPADLPVYPGASVMSQADQVIVLQTGDSTEKVSAYYEKEMTDLGYTAGETVNSGGMVMLSWQKDQTTLNIVIMSQGSSTMISITVE
jgi:hypothetical protein